MTSEAQQSREADLYLARQFGQAYVREMNSQLGRADFERVFNGDSDAQEQFEFGVVEEDQKRLALGMSLEEFNAYYETRQAKFVATRRSHGRV